MSFTNALLAQKISDLIDYWSSFNEEYSDWLGGTVDGGPGADGKYPLTNWAGAESLIDSPAKLADNVSGYVGLASASETAAAASAAAAATSESNASTSASTATAQAVLADADRVAAELAEANALSSQTVATAQANLATDRVGYASEWANAAFETLVSAAAGGDLVDDYSALHWATVAEGFAGSVDSGLYGQLAQAETVTGNWTFSGQINPTATRHNFGPTTADIPTGFLDDADAALVTVTNPTAAYAGDYGIHFTRNVDNNVGWSMWRDTSAGDLVINHEWNSTDADIVFRRYTTDLMRLEGDGEVSIPTGGLTVAGGVNLNDGSELRLYNTDETTYLRALNTGTGVTFDWATGGLSTAQFLGASYWTFNRQANGATELRIGEVGVARGGSQSSKVLVYGEYVGVLKHAMFENRANAFRIAGSGANPVASIELELPTNVTGALAATGAVTGSNLNVSNWDTAYGWGDHSTQNYAVTTGDTFTGAVTVEGTITAGGNQTRGVLSALADTLTVPANDEDLSPGKLYLEGRGAYVDWSIQPYQADLAIYASTKSSASPSLKITATGVLTWSGGSSTDANTAYSWGDHASGGYAPLAAPSFTGGITTDGLAVNGNTDLTGTVDILDAANGNTHFNYAGGQNYISHLNTGWTRWRSFDGVSTYTTFMELNSGGLTMYGVDGTTFNLELQGTAPTIYLKDTDTSADDFWIHVNSNNFYVLRDNADDGSWDSPHPLQLEADTNLGYLFGGEIVTTEEKSHKATPMGGLDLGTTDLNTINTTAETGFYFQNSNADTTGNNYPNAHAGSLLVQKSAGITQLYQTYTGSNRLYFRAYYSSSWSSWYMCITDAGTQTISGAKTFSSNPKRSSQGGYLHHNSSSYTDGGITFSTSARSGGTTGDIWFQYT